MNPMVFFSILCVTFFIYLEVKGKKTYAFFLKALSSFSFLALFAINIYYRFGTTPYTSVVYMNKQELLFLLFIFLGLVSGLVGDLLLELRPFDMNNEPSIILSGITAFSIGHIFYLIALITYFQFFIFSILFSFIVTLIVYIASRWIKMEWKHMLVPSLIYTFIIFLMVGQTLFIAVDQRFSLFTSILFAGGMLFGISDLILSQTYFNNQNGKGFIISNLSIYYASQILIAISILFM